MYDALQDPLLRPALQAFFDDQRMEHTNTLVHLVLQPIRDTMREARIAGQVQANEDGFHALEAFAKKQMEVAKQ